MGGILTVAPSPHIQGHVCTQRLMLDVIIALLPAWLVGVCLFGLSALCVTIVAVACCVGFEYLLTKYVLKAQPTISDLSAALTGLLLAMNLPSNLPIWMVIFGSLMAIGVGKVSFGGLGNNLFNPALFARAFLLISFPVNMTTWPVPQPGKLMADAATGATPLALLKNVVTGNTTIAESGLPSHWALFNGTIGGSLGEVSALALLIGGIYLLIRRVITWHIPVATLGTAALFGAICYWCNPTHYPDPLIVITSGGLMLGAIFMATDYVTSPMSKVGMLIYGVGIGALTIVIRYWGAYPEGVSFAILIMNAFVPLINKYIKPQKFGAVSRKGVK